jgi:hypothetical protein
MKRFEIVLVVALVGLVAGRLFAAPQESSSAADSKGAASASRVPRLVRFSGTVEDPSGKSLTGPADLHFAIYKDEADAAPLWQETQTLQLDEQGRYSVLLGVMQAEGLPVELFTSGEARWLGVQVGNLPEQPRVLLVSVPYALRAADAETLGGNPASAYALKSSSGTAPLVVALPASGTTAASLSNLTGTQPKSAVSAGATEFIDTTPDQVVRVTQDGEGLGLYALSRSSTAVLAKTLATSGEMFAARGTIVGPDGAGVYGQSTATTGAGYGVRGQSVSDGGAGILGVNTSPTGVAYGVIGITDSAAGAALVARARASSGTATALQGTTSAPSGTALFAYALARTGPATGVLAQAGSSAGTALVVDNMGGGKLMSAWSNTQEKLTVDGSGSLSTSGFLKAVGNASFGGNVGIGTSTPTERLQVVGGHIRISGTAGIQRLVFPDGTMQASAVPGVDTTSLGGVPAANYARLDTANTFSGDQRVNAGNDTINTFWLGTLTVNDLLRGSQFHGDGSRLTVNSEAMGALLTRIERLEMVLRPSFPNGAYLWAKHFGGPAGDRVIRVAVDTRGDIVITGGISLPVDFGGGPLNVQAGHGTPFVAKFSGVDGSHLWSKAFVVSGENRGDVGAFAIDAYGNVIVGGLFHGTLNFGGASLTTPSDASYLFLVKLSGTDGSHLWSKALNYSRLDATPGVAVDAAGDVFVTGIKQGIVDFGGGPLTGCSIDLFVVKFSGVDGSHLWSRSGFSQQCAYSYYNRGADLVVDGRGDILLTGYHRGQSNFGGGALTCSWQRPPEEPPGEPPEEPPGCIFLAKLSGANGSHMWSKDFRGANLSYTYSAAGPKLAVDPSGNALLTGTANALADFGGGPLTNDSFFSIFLAKFSAADGSHLWSKRFSGGSGVSDIHLWVAGGAPGGIAADASGNVLVTGSLTGTVDFGGGPVANLHFVEGAFVAKFSGADCSYIWLKSFPTGGFNTTTSDGSHSEGAGIAVDAGGNVLATGSFWGQADFGGGPLTSVMFEDERGNHPSEDIFLLKLHP